MYRNLMFSYIGYIDIYVHNNGDCELQSRKKLSTYVRAAFERKFSFMSFL